MSDEFPEPTMLDAVEAPDARRCQMWIGNAETPTRCDNPAEWLFVYDGTTGPGVPKPRNAFACGQCFAPPEDLSRNGDT
jgi:hypothetical protein